MRATTLLNRVLCLPKTTVRDVEFGDEVTVWVRRVRAARIASPRLPTPRTRGPSANPRSPRRRSGRTPALPRQSVQASSKESLTPIRRCSGLSTRKRPPNDQNACPPRFAAFSWSTRATFLPRLVNSCVATSPARPAPTTMTSAFMPLRYRQVRRRRSSLDRLQRVSHRQQFCVRPAASAATPEQLRTHSRNI